ncbi:MAG: hypothetical protein HY319_08125 [Armatimonadetes bacterium]|nr:hypothetical protein [Armatimonadota bacterium]
MQRFLEAMGSFLADFESDGKTAAQIVVDSGRTHQVNPWVILATLEKENSLVTRDSPPPNWVLLDRHGLQHS